MTESLFIYRSIAQRHCMHANNTKHKTNSISRWHKESEQAGHKRYRKFIKPRTATRRKAGESETSLRLAVSQSISNPCLTLCNPFSWSQKLEEFASGQWIHSFRPEHEWVWKKRGKEYIKRGEGLVENKKKIEVAGFRVAILWHEIIDRSRAESIQLFLRSNKPMFTENNKGKADIRRDVCK